MIPKAARQLLLWQPVVRKQFSAKKKKRLYTPSLFFFAFIENATFLFHSCHVRPFFFLSFCFMRPNPRTMTFKLKNQEHSFLPPAKTRSGTLLVVFFLSGTGMGSPFKYTHSSVSLYASGRRKETKHSLEFLVLVVTIATPSSNTETIGSH